jgi:uncharacterized membrane protein YfcA
LTPRIAARLVAVGLVVGAISGFFGIGGGFLIVPGLMLGSGMPILNAIGSSLLSVGSFGLTTAVNYALSGLVEWTIALREHAAAAPLCCSVEHLSAVVSHASAPRSGSPTNQRDCHLCC